MTAYMGAIIAAMAAAQCTADQSKAEDPQMPVETAVLRPVCETASVAIEIEHEQRRSMLVRAEIARREKQNASWWRLRRWRKATEPEKVKQELAEEPVFDGLNSYQAVSLHQGRTLQFCQELLEQVRTATGPNVEVSVLKWRYVLEQHAVLSSNIAAHPPATPRSV